jgi:hypothetical protein
VLTGARGLPRLISTLTRQPVGTLEHDVRASYEQSHDAGAGPATPPGSRPEDNTPTGASAEVNTRGELVSEYLRADPIEPPDPLRPMSALQEVVALCMSLEGGRRAPQQRDRRSLRADAQHSLTALGRELRRELQPALHDYFHGELANLPDLLDDTPGVVRLRAATQALLERVQRPPAAQAAWRDLVSAVTTGEHIEVCRLRAVQLREIQEALGHEWGWRERRLRELASEGSLNDCEELLSLPPARSAQVAWFIFANADIPDGYLRVGQVQFFSHRLWPEAVTDRDFVSRLVNAEFPAELDEDALTWLTPRDGAEAHVYARVELSGPRAEDGRNPYFQGEPPEQWARDLVSGIVAAGTFRVGGSAWKLLSGAALYHGETRDRSGSHANWSGSLSFDDPERLEAVRSARHPLHEGTGEALEELEPRVAELLAHRDPAAQEALGEVRWYESVRAQPDPAQRVALHIRAFERALPTSQTLPWNDAVKRYLREFWALNEFRRHLFYLAHASEFLISHHRPQELERLEQWLVHEGQRFSVSGGAFLRVAPKVASLLPRTARIERRQVRDAAKWAASAPATREAIAGLEQRFDVLLARALRQRNFIVHGIATVPEVVATIEPFIAGLAASIVAQTVHGVAVGEDISVALERGRTLERRTLWRLEDQAESVDQVLYGLEDSGL